MKIFWVIANDEYYPSAGLEDVVATFATRGEAEEYAKTMKDRRYVEVYGVSYLLGINE